MPTGYTAEIEEKDISFKEFALRCARAFGACMDMREEPLSEKIPDEFKPHDYHPKNIRESKEKLETIRRMSDCDAEAAASAEHLKETERIETLLKRRTERLIRYKRMIAAVDAWVPPTKDHVGLKEFMLDQIRISMPHNDEDFYKFPVKIDGPCWRAKQIDKILSDIAYHEKGHSSECEQVRVQNLWIKNLRESLEELP